MFQKSKWILGIASIALVSGMLVPDQADAGWRHRQRRAYSRNAGCSSCGSGGCATTMQPGQNPNAAVVGNPSDQGSPQNAPGSQYASGNQSLNEQGNVNRNVQPAVRSNVQANVDRSAQ